MKFCFVLFVLLCFWFWFWFAFSKGAGYSVLCPTAEFTDVCYNLLASFSLTSFSSCQYSCFYNITTAEICLAGQENFYLRYQQTFQVYVHSAVFTRSTWIHTWLMSWPKNWEGGCFSQSIAHLLSFSQWQISTTVLWDRKNNFPHVYLTFEKIWYQKTVVSFIHLLYIMLSNVLCIIGISTLKCHLRGGWDIQKGT